MTYSKDKHYRQGEKAGFSKGQKQGFEEGYNAALKKINPNKRRVQGAMGLAMSIGAWIAIVKILWLLLYVIWFFMHGTRGNEFISKLTAVALGPTIATMLSHPGQYHSVVTGFLLKPASQVPFLLLGAIAVLTALIVYFFYRDFLLKRHAVWTENFCLMLFSGLGGALAGFIWDVLSITSNLKDYLVSSIFIAVLVGSVSAFFFIFTEKAAEERQQQDNFF